MQQAVDQGGQIVRIHLQKFMTYDDICIRPGSNLNVIIGPNGTGKSTIACAVVLVLGGKLKTLGRADKLSAYIKSGCSESCIEIELLHHESENVVIKRKFGLNNQSEFFINGKISTSAKVNEIKKKFNIQVDNLCTFLPQEKVQDFAKLNHQSRLDQTLKAVGNLDLVLIYEELKKLKSCIIKQENDNCTIEDDLNNERQKNERLKDKVKCFKEKQSLHDRLTILNQKKAWLVYKKEVERKTEIENNIKVAEKAYRQVLKESEKWKEELAAFEENMKTHLDKVSELKRGEAGARTILEDCAKRAENRIAELEDLKSVVRSKIEEEEKKETTMLELNEFVEKLKNDLKTLETSIGPEGNLDEELEKVNDQLKKVHEEEVRLNRAKSELEEEEDTLKHQSRNNETELQNLKRRRDVRLEFLKRREPDVYKSMKWLEGNRHLFHSRIYNPMLLELDVPNTKMAKFVEARLGYRDLISFTCTSADDLNLLVKKLRTELNLKVNAVCSDEYESTQYSPEISLSDISCFGFHSYVKDLITGPDDILRFLCKTYRIHCVPVGDERVKAHCNKLPASISLFYSDKEVFTVKHSVYTREKSISVKKLEEPRFFTESLDEPQIQILADRSKKLQKKIVCKGSEIKVVEEQLKELRGELDKVKKRKSQLATIAEEKAQIQMKLQRIVAKFKAVKESRKNPTEIVEEATKQKQLLKTEIERSLRDLKLAAEKWEKLSVRRQSFELKLKTVRFGKNQILENEARCKEEVQRKELLLNQVKNLKKAAESICQQTKEKAMQLLGNVMEEEGAFLKAEERFARLPASLDEVEAEIEETKAKADFLQGGNLQVLQDYEKREETIEQLLTFLENSKKSLEAKKAELNSKRDGWLNPVSDLVSRINLNFGNFFEAMGCAGEVRLVSGEDKNDFDQYGIKILVKFRDGTPLQELGRFVQSGGERAVATAIFMLSLQELTSVPFRFVDEINQGMDPANEKRVLELIIRVTSKSATQYFFITPKLLSGIRCSQTMSVLCIYNGPNAIPAAEWDLSKFLGPNIEESGKDGE